MFPPMPVDKNSQTPAYRQIVEGVTSLIQQGKLKPGDRLPSERELAEQYELARGTVKKAYEKLAHSNVLEVIQGRGTFVSFRQNVLAEGRKEQAVKLIRGVLAELEKLNFSSREIANLLDLEIMEREERRQSFCIAAVDCNPEALQLFERQLGHLSRVRVVKFLLDDLNAEADPQKKLDPFQMIVTTSTHYSELLGMAPGLQERIVQVIVSPSQESIIELAKIGVSQEVGIICASQNFLRIVRDRLRDFSIAAKRLRHLLVREDSDITAFIAENDVIILPASYRFPWKKESMNALQTFRQRGGRLIEFNYQIERGSLLHLEERIKDIMQGNSWT
jgi:DNA-binding transcriptional regulator YhcF (GntR family)